MRKKVFFPLNGLSLELNLVSDTYDALRDVLAEAQIRGYQEGSLVRVEGRGDNAAVKLEPFDPNIKPELRIVSVLEENVVKYIIESYKPED